MLRLFIKKGEKTKKTIREVIDFNDRYYDFIYEITIEYSDSYKVVDTDYEIDTDGDGLSDALEYKYMTDKNNVDSDGDLLSDYLEVVILNYNPNCIMTYEDYINDSYRDYDGDGLSNIEEIQEHNTNPTIIDTDFDGLTDYDEINIYNTDPLDMDSDGDGLRDGVEIKLGLDPNSMMTDGSTLDNERKIEQNYDILELPKNLTSGDIKISKIEAEVSGDISENILINEYKDVNVKSSRVLVLEPFKIETKDSDSINFTFDVSKVSERQDKLCIVKYENGTLKAISTKYSDNVISGDLSDGIYGIADAGYILRELNINVKDYIH